MYHIKKCCQFSYIILKTWRLKKKGNLETFSYLGVHGAYSYNQYIPSQIHTFLFLYYDVFVQIESSLKCLLVLIRIEKQKYFILRNYMKVAPQSSKICANDEQKAPLILSASSVWVNSDCDNWKTLVPSFFSLNTV